MLLGEKINLVPIEKGDLYKTRLWANDQRLQALILRSLPVLESDQENWFENLTGNREKIVFAIKTTGSNEHIGNTGLYHIDWIHRRAEFWILIGETETWGCGIGTEVVHLMKKFSFDQLNLNRVYLKVRSDSDSAVGLYQKTGFVREGIARQEYYIEGAFRDIVIMSILREEYDSEK